MEGGEAPKIRMQYSIGYDKENKGLENYLGANNCFLNVVIQSLWHLASFRKLFKIQSLHKHKEGTIITKKFVGLNEGDKSDMQVDKNDESTNLLSADICKNIPLGVSLIDNEDFGAQPVSKEILDAKNKNLSSLNQADADHGLNAMINEESKIDNILEKELVPVNMLSYPEFDENGNILNNETKNVEHKIENQQVEEKYVDIELSLEEWWLFWNLITLFVKYEFDESTILTPLNVRQSLNWITGSNEVYGFSFGKMGWAQETFQAILEYLHRDFISPNYFEDYHEDLKVLKSTEDKLDNTGCSLQCPAHHVFGLEIGEFLSCNNCNYLSDVEWTHLDFSINLYSEELLRLDTSPEDALDTLVYKMYLNESLERK